MHNIEFKAFIPAARGSSSSFFSPCLVYGWQNMATGEATRVMTMMMMTMMVKNRGLARW